VFELQNKVRVNPKSFIPYLEASFERFIGRRLYSEDKKAFEETEEGQVAFLEAIEFLR
jgi:hypothetical protein